MRPQCAALAASVAAVSGAPAAVDDNPIAAKVIIPADLDCSDRPEWDRFRHAAVAHADLGWPDSPTDFDAVGQSNLNDLYATARALVEKWTPVVCTGECRTTEDLQWRWVEEWGGRCHSSANFDRYLVTHYFRNRNLTYSRPTPGDFCHYGFITALVIVAQFEFATSVARAQRFIYLAFTLLGDFFAFDWLGSSGWPVTALMLNTNLQLMSQGLVTGRGAEEWRVRFPGESGPTELRYHSRWEGTSEAGKPSAEQWAASSAQPRPQLVIWQFDGHTALAGEAKTMLVGFGNVIGVDTQFIGNSLADSTCGNYGLCPEAGVRVLISNLIDLYYKAQQPFALVAASFARAMAHIIAQAHVIMCGQPLFWCRFLLSLRKPCLMYAGLPLMWAVREEDKALWAEDFMQLLTGQQHVVIAESVFMARELHWQFGIRVPAMRVLGLHTRAVHLPLRKDSVLVSRFGTSGALSECVFQLFLQANRDWFPLQFAQLEAVLFEDHLARTGTTSFEDAGNWKEHIGEIKVPGMPYEKLAQHLAAVSMPYDTTIFLFNELYSTNIPIFVPRNLWRWLIGLHTSPSMEFRWDQDGPPFSHGPGLQFNVPQNSPFYAAGYKPMVLEQAIDWSLYVDWALLPHLLYFRGAPDLFLQLLDTATLHQTTSRMKAFNEEEVLSAVSNWRQVAHRLLYAARNFA